MKRRITNNYWSEIFRKAGYTIISCNADETNWQQSIPLYVPSILFIEAAFANDQGFEIARLARTSHPTLRCIICLPAVPAYYVKAIQIDASGYLPDDVEETDEVLHCIDQVNQGYRYISAVFLEALHLPTQRNADLINGLSDRQKQIISLVAKGYTARQIAQELNIAESTVQNHKYQISQQVGLEGVYQLKIFAGSVAQLLT